MKKRRFLAGAAALLLAASTAAPRAADTTPEAQLKARAAQVERLLERSSGAQRVEGSGNPQAHELHEQARATYREAMQALEAGDYGGANKLFSEATRTMFQAIRHADSGALLAEKQRRDYEARHKSVEALLEAHDRVAEEKKVGKAAREVHDEVARLVGEADATFRAGRLEEARALLDRAYITTKMAIQRMREGDTLTRSLNFATKEDEYKYELDRNDSHKMLVNLLLQEKKDNPYTAQMVARFSAQAEALRREAEEQAAAGDFEAAVKSLEESTKRYIRAIRSAGIFIPG
ncbi:hypothetical protein [Inmirania thermothiophila]|uniref:YfdX protein n=1 Tax=Inmirania thermothiophila TaxID=1750597 RepID=A0A3N1Y219_9GAMM|nr:hypothetical protein [Inmirania thermothiophila]ROR32859.1 hypothetical protein EDC57_2073 [Inmirania thermothiophila]